MTVLSTNHPLTDEDIYVTFEDFQIKDVVYSDTGEDVYLTEDILKFVHKEIEEFYE